MIESQFKNRISREKISRHSSHMALRKSSVQSGTPRESDTNQLSNVRKTTFWMKKNLGPENVPPNFKRIDSSQNKQTLSIKIQTKNSENGSIYVAKNEENEQNWPQADSKLALIEKSQKQIRKQAKILASQQIPKLSTCHKIFDALNKNIKLAYRNCSKSIKSQFQIMLDGYIEACSELFSKVLKYSNDFIINNKCAHLIARNIELQKQNKKLLDIQLKLQNDDYKQLHQKNKQKFKEVYEFADLKSIDYQRILLTNYKVADFRPQTINLNQLCSQMLKPYLVLNEKKSIGQFQLTNHIIQHLTQTRQANCVLKKFIAEFKNKRNPPSTFFAQKSKDEQSLSKSSIFDILLARFDFDILLTVKKCMKKMLKLGYLKQIQSGKISLKEILQLMNKLIILRNQQKWKEIAVSLLAKAELKERKKLEENEIKDIQAFLRQSIEGLKLKDEKIQPENIKNKGLSQHLQKAAKLNNLSNKRLINCASLYQSRNNLKAYISKKSCVQCFNSEITSKEEPIYPEFFTETYFDINEALLVLYWFVRNQILFLENMCFIMYKNLTHEQNFGEFRKILQKTVSKSVYQKLQHSHTKEKQAIIQINMRLLRVYDANFRQQFRKLAVSEILAYVKAQIVQILNPDEKKLSLTEWVNQNKKTQHNQSLDIQVFDSIQI